MALPRQHVRIRTRLLAITLAGAISALTAAAAARQSPFKETRRIMGTFGEVQVYHQDAGIAQRAISSALDEMQRVDRLLSTYDQTSELSAMNREAANAPFRASEELFTFVTRCRGYFTSTGGAFDPSVGPLVRAWGFFTPRPARPSDADIAAAKARSGFDKVRLNDADRTVSYAVAGLEIDPGGIGKGYAVDRAADILRRSGITSALVSAGGSTIYAIGHPPDRSAWQLAIQNPSSLEHPLGFVLLRDAAVSTSGVSQKSVVVDGHRYSHIFDPRTGEPIEGMCQVTVVTANATDSDALTKAAFILRRAEASRLFEREQKVHMLRVEGACGTDQRIWQTPWSSGVFEGDAGTAGPTPGR